MRLKLVPNYNYDAHTEASAQRDNMGTTQTCRLIFFSSKQNGVLKAVSFISFCNYQELKALAALNPFHWLLLKKQK